MQECRILMVNCIAFNLEQLNYIFVLIHVMIKKVYQHSRSFDNKTPATLANKTGKSLEARNAPQMPIVYKRQIL